MNHLLDVVKKLLPDLVGLKESAIENSGEVVGFESTFYSLGGNAIAGGTSFDRETARRIAVAEALERGLYRKLSSDSLLRFEFQLDRIDSTLGFGCGFERDKTAYRSYCEAVEKWALSKVIDDRLKINKTEPIQLSKLANKLLASFDKTYFFQKEIVTSFPFDNSRLELVFTLFVGCKDNGAFPGSQVTSRFDDTFTHAITEGWRNFTNFKLSNGDAKSILARRLDYFGQHELDALQQISLGNQIWPNLEIELFKEFQTGINDVYLFRTLMKDFFSVSYGPVTRFVI